MSDDFEPRWCVSSQEVGAGIMLYLFLGVIAFSVLPVFFLGYLLASKLWDVKIFKYPIALLLASMYGWGLWMLYTTVSKGLTLCVVLFTWLILDYVVSHKQIKQMWLIRSIQRLYRWLFSK